MHRISLGRKLRAWASGMEEDLFFITLYCFISFPYPNILFFLLKKYILQKNLMDYMNDQTA